MLVRQHAWQELTEESPSAAVRFRCSDRRRRCLGHHDAAVPIRPHNGRDQPAHYVGFHPMKTFVFAALVFTAIFWDTTAIALRQAPQEHLTMKEVSAGWSMTETMAAPDLSINVW
jgi:hypothetical protein